MKNKVLHLLALLSSLSANSQVTHAFKVPGLQVNNVFADQNGDFYALGFPKAYYNYYYDDTKRTNYFIRKYAPNSTLLWEKTLGTHSALHIAGTYLVNDKLFIGGNFRDTLFYAGGNEVSEGENDLFVAVINAAGQMTLTVQGGSGNEEMRGFTVDPSEHHFLSCLVQGNTQFGSLNYMAAPAGECILMQTTVNFMNTAWSRIGTAVGDQGIGVPELRYDNGKLLGTSSGSTIIQGTNETFGCDGGNSLGYKWNLSGTLLARTPDFSSPYGSVKTNFVDSAENYYALSYSHGNHGEWQLQIIKYDQGLNQIWHFEDRIRQHSLYNLERDGSKFYSSATAYDSSSTQFNTIMIHDVGTGSVISSFSHALGVSSAASAYVKKYPQGSIYLYGTFVNQVTLGTSTLAATTATIAESYIAMFDPVVLGIYKTPGHLVCTLFPNPGNGKFVVKIPAQAEGSCRVIGVHGQVLLEQKLSPGDMELDLSAISPGLYLLDFSDRRLQPLRIIRE